MSLFVQYKALVNVCLFCSLVTGSMMAINFKKVAVTEGEITKTFKDISKFDCALSCEFDDECFGYKFNSESIICFVLRYANVSDVRKTFISSEKNIIFVKERYNCLDTPQCTRCRQHWTGPNCETCETGWAGPHCDVCDTNFGPPGICHCMKGWAGRDCDVCDHGWVGSHCDMCETNFGPPGQCDSCNLGWAGSDCGICDHGWTNVSCDTCDAHFGPAGLCNSCLTGCAWPNCDSCDANFGPPGLYNSCLTGWNGSRCDTCATNFGPTGQCNTCNAGWTGASCNVCKTNFGPRGLCNSCNAGWTGPNCDMCDTNFGPPGQCNKCDLGFTGQNCSSCATELFKGYYIENDDHFTMTWEFSGSDCNVFTGTEDNKNCNDADVIEGVLNRMDRTLTYETKYPARCFVLFTYRMTSHLDSSWNLTNGRWSRFLGSGTFWANRQ